MYFIDFNLPKQYQINYNYTIQLKYLNVKYCFYIDKVNYLILTFFKDFVTTTPLSTTTQGIPL